MPAPGSPERGQTEPLPPCRVLGGGPAGRRLPAEGRGLSGRLLLLDGGHLPRWVLAVLCTIDRLRSLQQPLLAHLSAGVRPTQRGLGPSGSSFWNNHRGPEPWEHPRGRKGRSGCGAGRWWSGWGKGRLGGLVARGRDRGARRGWGEAGEPQWGRGVLCRPRPSGQHLGLMAPLQAGSSDSSTGGSAPPGTA